MKENMNLLIAIRKKGLTQKRFAELVGDTPSQVSQTIRGWLNLNNARKIKYAQVLGKEQSELFED